MSIVWTIGLTCDEKSLDEISPDPDPLVGAVMEKLVHSRLVGGDGVLFVLIGVNVGLLECLADDVSRPQLTWSPNFSQYMKRVELISFADKNARVECPENHRNLSKKL